MEQYRVVLSGDGRLDFLRIVVTQINDDIEDLVLDDGRGDLIVEDHLVDDITQNLRALHVGSKIDPLIVYFSERPEELPDGTGVEAEEGEEQ